MLGDVSSILSQNRTCRNHASLHELNYYKNSQIPNVEDNSSFKTVQRKHTLLHIILHWQSRSGLNSLMLGFSFICICICRDGIFIKTESERAPSYCIFLVSLMYISLSKRSV